jgi:hypothetical protein
MLWLRENVTAETLYLVNFSISATDFEAKPKGKEQHSLAVAALSLASQMQYHTRFSLDN